MKGAANKITGANAGGPPSFRIRALRAARIAQFHRSAMKGKPMTGHASRYAIVAVEANVTLDDPDEVVGSNLWLV